MGKSSKIRCGVHGLQDESFVCQHIMGSLHTGTPVGFHWSAASTAKHPDAWCTACDEARSVAGGEWSPEVEEQLGIKLLCGACYERAKSIWSGGKSSGGRA